MSHRRLTAASSASLRTPSVVPTTSAARITSRPRSGSSSNTPTAVSASPSAAACVLGEALGIVVEGIEQVVEIDLGQPVLFLEHRQQLLALLGARHAVGERDQRRRRRQRLDQILADLDLELGRELAQRLGLEIAELRLDPAQRHVTLLHLAPVAQSCCYLPRTIAADNSRQRADAHASRRWAATAGSHSSRSQSEAAQRHVGAALQPVVRAVAAAAVDQMQRVGVARAVREVGAAAVRQLAMQQDQRALRARAAAPGPRSAAAPGRASPSGSCLPSRTKRCRNGRRWPPGSAHMQPFSPSHPRAPARSRRSSTARCAGRCCPGGRSPRRRSAAA